MKNYLKGEPVNKLPLLLFSCLIINKDPETLQGN